MCVGVGGCADGTGTPGEGSSAGSETCGPMTQAWNWMLKDHQEWSGPQPMHYLQPPARCVCPRALVHSRSGSLDFGAVLPGLEGLGGDKSCYALWSQDGRHLSYKSGEKFLWTVPVEWEGPWSRGGGGGRPGEDVNRARELA